MYGIYVALVPFIFAGIVIYIIAQGIIGTAAANPIGFWFTVGSPIALILAFVVDNAKRRSARIATLPPDGPMLVDIQEVHKQEGRYACYLIIDVKISRKDWDAIRAAKLDKYTIFSSLSPSGPIENDNTWDFKVSDLEGVTKIGFPTVPLMHDAKEKLIQGLHSLRAQIDGYREGPQRERFEI